MGSSGDRLAVTRRRNTGAFEAFGVSVSHNPEDGPTRVVRKGNGTKIFTVGYERRSGEELLAELLALGIEILVDVREKPISRKPDFRPTSTLHSQNTGTLTKSFLLTKAP